MALKDFGFTTFTDILVKGARSSTFLAQTKLARGFIRKMAQRATTDPSKLIRDKRANFRNQIRLGEMYGFFYDPKGKKDLPFYDKFPLIFPIETYSDGFLGINMHYLPPKLRAVLMDNLWSLANNKKLDESTRLRATYQVLNNSAKYRFFKPTVKRYLFSQMRSRFLYIEPIDWEVVLFLPLARFEKASQSTVWIDSVRKLAG